MEQGNLLTRTGIFFFPIQVQRIPHPLHSFEFVEEGVRMTKTLLHRSMLFLRQHPNDFRSYQADLSNISTASRGPLPA